MSFSDNKKELFKSAIENQFATFEYNTLNSPEWKSEVYSQSNVSTLSGFQKYFHANSVKGKFESLTSEFESAMKDLYFTTNLRNEEQRRIDHESLNSDLQEMAKFLNTIGENVIDTNQQLNTVLKEIATAKNQMVSSKSNTTPITANEELKDPNASAFAILGKLKESRNILKFYGLSKYEDQHVMIFEWAEHDSLQEVYLKYDIGLLS
ncbi:hypothetical protein Glove_334g54 [Diversispora epigaea]|uniref:Protein kinase domain-containing protein n=1 Tax=Diversispora epigaea TaxID=1348612 RepID=A0A397HMS0_9GLOM|nr:hypothetical protein Glove_334g54 [Diversispora epigaea]